MNNLALKYQDTAKLVQQVKDQGQSVFLKMPITEAKEVETFLTILKNRATEPSTTAEEKIQLNQEIHDLYAMIRQRIAITNHILNVKSALVIPTAEDIQMAEKSKNNQDSDLIDQPIEERQVGSDKKVVAKKGETLDATKRFTEAAAKQKVDPLELAEEVKELEAGIADVIKTIIEDSKKEKHISIKSQITLDKFAIAPELQARIISEVAKALELKEEELVWDAYNQSDANMLIATGKTVFILNPDPAPVQGDLIDAPAETADNHIEDAVIVGMTFETLRNECVTMLENTKSKLVKKHFYENVKNVTDFTEEQNKDHNKVWESICIYKRSLAAKPNASPETKEEKAPEETTSLDKDKEKIVETAQAAAEAGLETIPETLTLDQVKEKGIAVIVGAIESGAKSAINIFRQFASKKEVRNVINSIEPNEKNEKVQVKLFKELHEEAKKLVKPAQIIKPVDLEKMDPTILEEVKKCTTIEEFKDFIHDLVLNKKLWPEAHTLVLTHLITYPGCEKWENGPIETWFKEAINKKPELTQEKVEEARTTETTTTEVVDKEDPAHLIKTEGDSKRVTAAAGLFILNGLSANRPLEDLKTELTGLLKESKFYKRSPVDELAKTVANIIKKNPEIQKLLK